METTERMARPTNRNSHQMSYEYTTIWWIGSTTHLLKATPVETHPPITPAVEQKLNDLGAQGWELVGITAAPLTTGWISPRGGPSITGFTDKVHYLASFKRPLS